MTDQNPTRMLKRLGEGDAAASDDLLPVVYDELRRLARRYLGRRPSDSTLQPTALVHEAYMRLINQDQALPADRAHFVGLAARAMRSVLVDHARARNAAKRGGGRQRVALDDWVAYMETRAVDLLALDDALDRLAEIDERQSRIVELRFFGGLSVEESAAMLGTSTRTIEREWRLARAWLRQRIRSGHPEA